MYSVRAADGALYGPVDEQTLQAWVQQGRVVASTEIVFQSTQQQTFAGNLGFLQPLLGVNPPSYATTSAVAYGQPGMAPTGGTQLSYQAPSAYGQVSGAHQLTAYPVWGVALLHIVTLGFFSFFRFNFMHDQMPKQRFDDPSTGKAIGFMFIPFDNVFYWRYFNYTRLSERIAELRQVWGLPPDSCKGLATAYFVMAIIPYVNAIAYLIISPIFFCTLQARVNELVRVSGQAQGRPRMM